MFAADGQAKIGHFTVAFDDLTIPLRGIPIAIPRTYDSRDRSEGDFGHGWNLAVGNTSVTKSSVLGDAFEQVVEAVGNTATDYKLRNLRNVFVDVTLPDGRVEKFIMGYTFIRYYSRPPLPLGGLGLGLGGLGLGGLGGLGGGSRPKGEPLQQTTLFFAPRDGRTTSTLESLEDNTVEVSPAAVGPVRLLDRRSGQVYDPKRWKLTTQDGSVFVLNVDRYERIA